LSTPRVRVDLVLLDVVLPGKDGVALYADICARWPEMPIVFMSGHSAEIRREAVLASDMTRAWDASSAAAGALMLAARARADIQSALRLPQLR